MTTPRDQTLLDILSLGANGSSYAVITQQAKDGAVPLPRVDSQECRRAV